MKNPRLREVRQGIVLCGHALWSYREQLPPGSLVLPVVMASSSFKYPILQCPRHESGSVLHSITHLCIRKSVMPGTEPDSYCDLASAEWNETICESDLGQGMASRPRKSRTWAKQNQQVTYGNGIGHHYSQPSWLWPSSLDTYNLSYVFLKYLCQVRDGAR